MPDVSNLPDLGNVVNQQVHDTTPGGAVLNGDTVKFTSEAPSTEAVLPKSVDPTTLSSSPDSALLQNFLRRPVLIHTFEWTAAAVGFQIDPWAKYFNTASVKDKISNYRYGRGSLHIDVQLNGTPFHYGRILAAYIPMNGINKAITGGFNQHSQCPHIMLDPSTNAIGKITAPFISPNQWMDFTNENGVQLGKMFFDIVADLAVFEGGTAEPVTVQVYAWLEDIELAYPTQLVPATFVEQGKKKSRGPNNGNVNVDEYTENPNEGLISRPAAMLANIAGKLTTIPVIGPFATATQIGAGALSQIASLFGYSSPKDLSAPTVVISRPVGFMSTGDTADQVAPLTLNSKSELTIDPGAIGIDTCEDELAVGTIAGRWGLSHLANWNNGDAPNTVLSQAGVNPAMYVPAFDVRTGVSMTPAMYASLPFGKWRGSMEIKVQIVASRYHRGRLRFQWTPEHDLSNDIQLGYNHVVDISDTKEFHLKLPYVGQEGFKDVYPFQTGDPSAFAAKICSGHLKIIVQNVLGAGSVEPVSILVWVRCGDDMIFTEPDLQRIARCTVVPNPVPAVNITNIDRTEEQSGGAKLELGDAALNEEVIISFFDEIPHPNYELAYFGDPVRSFRPLLKRYTYETTISLDGALATLNRNDVSVAIPAWPLAPGFFTNAGSWTTAAVSANVVQGHLANYLSYTHLATKGSFRVMVSSATTENAVPVTRFLASRYKYAGIYNPFYGMKVSQIPDADTVGGKAAAWNVFGDSGGTQEDFRVKTSGSGAQLFNTSASSGMMELEVPYYQPYKYSCHMGAYFDNPLSNGDSWSAETCQQGVKVQLSTLTESPITQTGTIGFDIYKAAGEDFTVSCFTGVPLMWKFAMTIEEIDAIASIYRHNAALE